MSELDQSEFHYHVIRSPRAWNEGILHQLELTEAGIRIQSANDYKTETTLAASSLLPSGGRLADIAGGPCGMLLLLDDVSGKVYAFDPMYMQLDKPEGLLFTAPGASSIAYSDGLVLVLEPKGNSGQMRLSAYSEINGQLVWTADSGSSDLNGFGLPPGWSPYDVIAGSSGHLYTTSSEGLPVARFDRGGRCTGSFGPGGVEEQVPVGPRLTAAAAPDETLLVLDRDMKAILSFSPEGTYNRRMPLDERLNPCSIALDNSGVIYIGEHDMQGGEYEPLIRLYNPAGEAIGMMTEYRQSVDRIVFCGERMFLFNRGAQTVTVLKRKEALFRESGSPISKGEFISRSMDSTEEAIHWHKLVLDRTIPDNTMIKVFYLTADTRTFLINGTALNLDDYIADTRIRIADKIAALQHLPWSEASVNPRDVLIRVNTGRYLWVRVQLLGSDKQTPLISGIRADFPRLSYLRFLPAVYQVDQASRDLLERFLSMTETFMTELDRQITASPRWLDVDAVEGGYLRWLGTWIAVTADPGWAEDKLRKLIQHMPELHRKRGTKEGIERIVEIYTGERPIIIENFQLQSVVDPDVKQVYAELFGDDPYRFCVLLKPEQAAEASDLTAVKRMIELDKPAHTIADVTWLQPWIYLGGHTYLGMNTYLTKPSSRLDDATVLQRDTLLTDETPFGQVDVRSGTGADTLLA